MVAVVITLVALFGLLESVSIITDMNLKNQVRDEAVQVGETTMNSLMAASSGTTANPFDNYSALVPSRLRGVSTRYKVNGIRTTIGPTNSKSVKVTVAWTYRGKKMTHTVSSMKTNTQ